MNKANLHNLLERDATATPLYCTQYTVVSQASFRVWVHKTMATGGGHDSGEASPLDGEWGKLIYCSAIPNLNAWQEVGYFGGCENCIECRI